MLIFLSRLALHVKNPMRILHSLLFLLISIIFVPVPPCSPSFSSPRGLNRCLGQTTEGTPFSGLGPVPTVASQSRRKRSSASTVGVFAASCHTLVACNAPVIKFSTLHVPSVTNINNFLTAYV